MDFLKSTVDAAKARANTALEAKKLLEDGGPPMERAIGTKAAARNAVQADLVTLAQCNDAIAQYETALGQMEAALTPETSGALRDEDKAAIASLIPEYRRRADALRAAAATLGLPPAVVDISAVEEDAIKLLYVKGVVEDAKARSQKVADAARAKIQSHSASSSAAPAAAPAPATTV